MLENYQNSPGLTPKCTLLDIGAFFFNLIYFNFFFNKKKWTITMAGLRPDLFVLNACMSHMPFYLFCLLKSLINVGLGGGSQGWGTKLYHFFFNCCFFFVFFYKCIEMSCAVMIPTCLWKLWVLAILSICSHTRTHL